MIKIVLFDIDDTLLSFEGYVKETMREGFAKFGICTYEEPMFGVFDRINRQLWKRIEDGEITFAQLQEVRWNRIFDALGVDFDGKVFEEYFRAALFDSAIPEKGAMELLESLFPKYPLFVVSNGGHEQQMNRLNKAGMTGYFAGIFTSGSIGAPKPSEEFFTECFRRIEEITGKNVKHDEIMIVGDSLTSDMVCGEKYGIRTCFYDPKKKGTPKNMKIDYTVTSLDEIRKFL